ncbi:hypothetical protein Pmani_022389 [Petrolisthes manimaculis]|uniref:F-box domain-containing protein n=1 Tax=Petrolisthes manimaculis TaxID=1843537 RepID=A0AAE1NZK2_9EUCA|nr:hypothetical protein Pmani_029645 [Petrolisthes manimaculis]KAK4305730.1 hypothetical protein Pmani_022389 [Petrolisthes manimaculis]
MSALMLDQLPEIVLLRIMQFCSAEDLVSLQSTCKRIHDLSGCDVLWKTLCVRDFGIDDIGTTAINSFHTLYTNLLFKYGYMLGLYQSQVGPLGGLLEVRYQKGVIEGVSWEPSSMEDVSAPLKEYLYFSVSGYEAGQPQCFPGLDSHTCTLSIDKDRGIITQLCSKKASHSTDSSGMDFLHLNLDPRKVRQIFLSDTIRKGLEHHPLIIPSPSSIPSSLLNKDHSIPRQIFAPGLFQGSYSSHGLETILFTFKDENEMLGIKVTGDTNVFASKATVKLLLRYPVAPSITEQKSLKDLKNMEPSRTDAPIHDIVEQPFVVPEDCYERSTMTHPSKCMARYHGLGQIAAAWYHGSRFIPIQVVVFNNDLIGVLWLKLASFSLLSRIKQTFTQNVLKNSRGALHEFGYKF